MAYTEIQPTTSGTPSSLGDYTFNCEFHDSGSAGTMARASMTKDGQTVYKSVSIPNTAQIQGYTIEANENEATVYAVIKKQSSEGGHESGLDTSPATQPIPSGNVHYRYNNSWYYEANDFSGVGCITAPGGHGVAYVLASSEEGATVNRHTTIDNYWQGRHTHTESDTTIALGSSFTFDGKTVYYGFGSHGVHSEYTFTEASPAVNGEINARNAGAVAWTMIYGTYVGPGEYEEKMVGRFAIDLEDAGGVGPGSDWTDPGDYDPDWEEGDPTHTLYVTVTGALSGRHNDPIVDPSYSYIPADKDTVKDYGCGGDGGHGGGGGAGASTVVVHKFATNQANYKEVIAIARRHGYGSGGGKGGKGGDGCILVYY